MTTGNTPCIVDHDRSACRISEASFLRAVGSTTRRCCKMIQGIGNMSGTAARLYQEGSERMQSYCHSSACRHALVVNFFSPGSMPDGQPCTCVGLLSSNPANRLVLSVCQPACKCIWCAPQHVVSLSVFCNLRDHLRPYINVLQRRLRLVRPAGSRAGVVPRPRAASAAAAGGGGGAEGLLRRRQADRAAAGVHRQGHAALDDGGASLGVVKENVV